jgi:MoxR-like ATPase
MANGSSRNKENGRNCAGAGDGAAACEETNGRKLRDPRPRPARGGGFTARLGVFGWEKLEPVLLAALADRSPLLLVGAHGTAKSLLVERIAGALSLAFRHYNASLINYDDLVGIPLPEDGGASLRFVAAPGAIWEAEFVFFDEISRCRPDLQNKLFPIVHERRVAGIDLGQLRHRWAAMNPPAGDGADVCGADDVYLGSEPLDPALADRFVHVVRVPDWEELSPAARRSLVAGRETRDSRRRRRPEPPGLAELLAATAALVPKLARTLTPRLTDYVLRLVPELAGGEVALSPRRARMLLRAVVTVHAARVVLEGRGAELEESAFLALRTGLPQTACAAPPSPALVLAAHRQAWEVAQLAADDAWRKVLAEPDPVERVLLGDRLGLPDGQLARLVTRAVGAQPDDNARLALGTALFLHFRDERDLTPGLHLLHKKTLPALDAAGRPTEFFARSVHERCEYYADYQENRFATHIGEDRCLFHLGCQGPVSHNDCNIDGHNGNVNNCIRAGHPCVGCAGEEFPRRILLHVRDDDRVILSKEHPWKEK